MKLYFARGACSLAVRIILNELGINCEYESVDLQTKKTASNKDFLTINPKGVVPVIQLDNGQILTENTAILQYIADQFSANQLCPPIGDFKRYRVLEWLSYMSSEVHKSFGILFNHTLSEEIKDQTFKPIVKSKLDYVNRALDNNSYLVGNEFSLPDAYLFVMLSWLGHFRMDLKEWPNLSRYFNELKQRKSIAKSLQEESL